MPCPAMAQLAIAATAAASLQRTEGVGFQCALQGPPNAVSCWGVNDQGQLGQGDMVPRPLTPEQVLLGAPVQNITSGAHHSCAVLTNGQARAFDSAEFIIHIHIYLYYHLLPIYDIYCIHAYNARCATLIWSRLRNPGPFAWRNSPLAQVKCWGGNRMGQLGTGDQLNRGDREKQMGDWLRPVARVPQTS